MDIENSVLKKQNDLNKRKVNKLEVDNAKVNLLITNIETPESLLEDVSLHSHENTTKIMSF